MNINKITTPFEPEKLTFDNPGRLQGGSYYCKIKYDSVPFYIQTPVIATKNGIKETSKKTYCDLMFEQTDRFTDYITNLETTIKERLFERSKIWFYNELDEDDIEMFYHSCMRNYKFKYQLMRTYVNRKTKSSKDILEIYDEDEILRNKEDIVNKHVICIIKFKGITFTSTSFTLDIELVQVMIIENHNKFNKCMIVTSETTQSNTLEKNTVIDNENIEPNNETVNVELTTTEEDNETQNVLEETNTDVVVEEFKSTPNEDVINEENTNVIDSSLGSNEEETLGETDVTKIFTGDEETTQQEDTTPLDLSSTEIKVLSINRDDNLEDTTNEKTLEQTETEIATPFDDILEDTQPETENAIISVDLDSLIPEDEPKDVIEEVSEEINAHNEIDSITLRDRRDVYYEIYEQAHKKAKLAKQMALKAYLEARQIRNQYLIEESDSSSEDEDLDNLSVYSEDELIQSIQG